MKSTFHPRKSPLPSGTSLIHPIICPFYSYFKTFFKGRFSCSRSGQKFSPTGCHFCRWRPKNWNTWRPPPAATPSIRQSAASPWRLEPAVPWPWHGGCPKWLGLSGENDELLGSYHILSQNPSVHMWFSESNTRTVNLSTANWMISNKSLLNSRMVKGCQSCQEGKQANYGWVRFMKIEKTRRKH